VRVWVLCGLSGCGAAVYFPVEPGPRDTAPPTLETAATGDTGVPPDTDPPITTTPTPTSGGLPCSFLGSFQADLHVVNQRSVPLNLYWRDFYCNEYPYGQVAPGGDFLQGSYEHQAWVVRDAYGGSVESIVIDEAYEQWVIQ
jgi:hypothetical protein